MNGFVEISTLLIHSAPKQKSNEWMHLSPFYTRMHGEWLRYAKSTSQFHWRFLLVRDVRGFQVNPLCRHDITRSDRQIGNCLYNYRWLSIYIVRLLFYTHAHRYYFIHYIFVRCNKSSDKQQKTILYWNFLIRSVRCKRNHVWWWFLSSPLVLSRLTTAVVFFCPAVAAGMH